MIGIALLGAGRIGRLHAQAIIKAGARLVSVYDVFADAAGKVSAEYGAIHAQSFEEAVDRHDIQGVLIATSTDTHVDFIVRAAKLGKAVLCEKPLALDLDEAARCLDEIKPLGIPVQLGFNRRFDPSHAALQSALYEGKIGALEQITITSRDPAPPPLSYVKVSGGIFRDMMIHDFDMARFLLREEPTLVMAQGACLVDPEIGRLGDVDTATVMLRTQSGKQCVILNSRRAVYGYDQRIEAFGSNGMLISDNHRENSIKRFLTDMSDAGAPLQNFFLERYADSYRIEIEAFLNTLTSGADPLVDIMDGYRALLLADAAQRSMDTAKPVEIHV